MIQLIMAKLIAERQTIVAVITACAGLRIEQVDVNDTPNQKTNEIYCRQQKVELRF
jgi:hypothetical protein